MTDFAQKDEDLGGTIAEGAANADPAEAALPPIDPGPSPDMAEVPAPPENPILPPPDDDAGFFEDFGAAAKDERIRTDAWNYMGNKRRTIANEMFDLLPFDAQERVRGRLTNIDTPGQWQSFEDHVVREAAEIAKLTPETARVFAGFPLSKEAFDMVVEGQRKEEMEAAQRILDQPGGAVAEFLGASWTAMTDEASLMLMPLGGGTGSAWKMVLREVGLGALGEAAVLPREYRVAEEMNIEAPDAVSRIAWGGVLGGGIAAGFHGLSRGVQRAYGMWRGHRDGIRAVAPDGDELEAEIEIDAEEARLRGTETVQQRVGPKSPPPAEPGTLGAVLGKSDAQPGSLPPVGPGAPEGWTEIRNGIFVGESGGDYNALFGYQNRKGGKFSRVKLTEMTVDQAIAFSDPKGEYGQWVKGKIGRVATPMGAYQIVGTTLRAAKHALGLRGNEVMTPELQEELGHWIYRTQGTGAWEGYKGPRKTFVPVDASADVPNLGPTSRGYTGENQMRVSDDLRIDVEYMVVDASTLRRASGDLQPRDRSGVNSDVWIAEQAARLDPAQLMRSPNASTGAPLIGPDNIIESGNGRFAIINRAYDHHPDRAAAYRAGIEGAGFPIPAGVERPVLVAMRKTEMDHDGRVRLVNDAQDSGVAVMRPIETAKANARNLTDTRLAQFRSDLELDAAENRGFVKSWLESLSSSVRSAVTDGDNGLNSFGRRMVREAIFARAWPEDDLIEMMTEGAAGEMKSLMDALIRAAPDWALLRADIAAGRIGPEFDLTPNVLDAMQLIVAARQTAKKAGQTMAAAMADLLDSPDLLDGFASPVTLGLLRKFWRNGRTAPEDEIAGFLARYAAEARNATHAATGFFDAPSPVDALRAIDGKIFGDLPDDVGAALGARPPAASREPVALPDQGFDQGAASPEAETADTAMRGELEADGPFGPVFRDVENDPESAIARLMTEKNGEVPVAFTHPDKRIGEVAFVYGNDRMGLRHIEAKHPEMLARLPDILRNGRVIPDAKGLPRIYLAIDGDPAEIAIVRLDYDGAEKHWVVSSFADVQETVVARQAQTSNELPASAPSEIPDATGQAKDSVDLVPDQAPAADPVAAEMQRLREEYADLEIELPDSTKWTARDFLGDVDSDEMLEKAVETCAINPEGMI